jgi:hypothetical protein
MIIEKIARKMSLTATLALALGLALPGAVRAQSMSERAPSSPVAAESVFSGGWLIHSAVNFSNAISPARGVGFSVFSPAPSIAVLDAAAMPALSAAAQPAASIPDDHAETLRIEAAKTAQKKEDALHPESAAIRPGSWSDLGRPEDRAETARIEAAKAGRDRAPRSQITELTEDGSWVPSARDFDGSR